VFAAHVVGQFELQVWAGNAPTGVVWGRTGARAIAVVPSLLHHEFRHDLIGIVEALAGLMAQREDERSRPSARHCPFHYAAGYGLL